MRMQLASKIHYKTDDDVFVLPTVASFLRRSIQRLLKLNLNCNGLQLLALNLFGFIYIINENSV